MITNIASLPLKEMVQRYLIANTAAHVFRAFRDLPDLQDYAANNLTADIALDLKELAHTEHRVEDIAHDIQPRNPSDKLFTETLVIFYALLISLSFKPYAEIVNVLKEYSLIKYDFLPDLLFVIGNYAVPQVSIEVECLPSVTSFSRRIQSIDYSSVLSCNPASKEIII